MKVTPTLLKIVLFLVLFKSVSAQEIEWQNAIGGSHMEQMKSISQTTDGGYICGGFTFSNISGDKTEDNVGGSDYWILKLDSVGNLQWQNALGGSDNDELDALVHTADGGYFCAGNSRSNASGDKSEDNIGLDNFWVVKLQSAGVVEWENTIGGSSMDLLRAAINTDDGGFLIGGSSTSNISGDKTEDSFGGSDYWVIKLNSTGNIVWQKTIGGNTTDFLYDINKTADGGYICGGTSDSDISGNKTENSNGLKDYWIVKLDSVGNIEWQNSIGGNNDDVLISISQTTDGGYICGGYSNSGSSGDKTEMNYGGFDYWVLKLDNQGNISWQNAIGGNLDDELLDLQVHGDDGYICGGGSISEISFDKSEKSQGDRDFWVMKLDLLGQIQWQNTIGGSGMDEIISLQPTLDEGIICGGNSLSSNSGDKTEASNGLQDFWIVKITTKYNLIKGRLYEDLDLSNSYNPGEILISNRKVEDSNSNKFAYTDQAGYYSIVVLDTGSFSVEPDLNNIYYNLTPVSHSVQFYTFLETDSLNDFAFQPVGNINDLCINITPITPFRTGANASYRINFTNEGNTILNPTIIFYLDTNFTFNSSIPVASAVYPDSVIWNYGSLAPFSNGSIVVTVNINLGLTNGQVINSGAAIFPIIGDPTPQCNLNYWESNIIGSHDPNDIVVSRKTLLDTEIVSPPYLEYLIRFQNTGNDTAFYVRIDNSIPEDLNLGSFEIIDISHPYRVEYQQYDSTMKFIFENILLPDSNVNESGSHGYIRYRIKPTTTLLVGDSILNYAAITFDYNAPIKTNIAVTEIIQSSSLSEFSGNNISVYPNPCDKDLTLECRSNTYQNTLITLWNIYGQKVMTLSSDIIELGNWKKKLDLSGLPSGVYILTIEGDDTFTKKIVKL